VHISSDGGSPVVTRGVCWGTGSLPTLSNNSTSNGSGTGSYIGTISGLSLNTTYYVRAYASNAAGTAYGNQLSIKIVDVINPATGKIWMATNQGTSKAATSSTDTDAYGDLYQWGRNSDGHQIRNSDTTSILSSNDYPGNSSFIIQPNPPYDWHSFQNLSLWQGVSGVNNPCPSGYRLPTDTELDDERSSWSSQNSAGAFASPLRWSLAGYRKNTDGTIASNGLYGYYWSSTVSGSYSRCLYFSSSSAGIFSSYRSNGFSVRCIKD
ncbi:MAG: hypothetical protein ACK5CO_09905, partial [Bacteroidota bacterium]